MTLLPFVCPSAPDWSVDWHSIAAQFEWIRQMKGCPQDPAFHAEGDVFSHVRLVSEAMAGLSEWRVLPSQDREILFAAALLHDVAKPACTRHENGRITSRGHSLRGAIMARRILWECGADLIAREQICALVSSHQVPFFLIDRPDSERMAYRISQTARCDLLAILARADALGRTCTDQADVLTRVELFQEFCAERDCLASPRAFPSNLSRFEYFRAENRDPHYLAHEESTCEVVLMSGLPGAGKNTWIERNLASQPCISLDEIREEIDAGPTGNQGPVVQEAKQRAKALLRERRSFVWNATNLSRDIRSQLVDIFTAYHARTRIVYVDASFDRLHSQNSSREDAVPPNAIDRMLDRWEPLDPTEAAQVEWWGNAAEGWTLLKHA